MSALEILSVNLKKIRKNMHHSQLDFAVKCGISTETLSLIECQKIYPRLSTIQKIAAYIGCEAQDLLTQDCWKFMNHTYQLRTDTVVDEYGQRFTVFGVDAFDANGDIVKSIPNIWFDKTIAEKFVELCRTKNLALVHLQDVIEDQLI